MAALRAYRDEVAAERAGSLGDTGTTLAVVARALMDRPTITTPRSTGRWS